MKFSTFFKSILIALTLMVITNIAYAENERKDPTKDEKIDTTQVASDTTAVSAEEESVEEEEEQEMGIVTFIAAAQLPRIYLGFAISVIGIILLIKFKMSGKVRFWFMSAAFFLFSVVAALPFEWIPRGFGLHPSPVCATTNPFAFTNLDESIPVFFFALLFFVAVMTLISNKSFCAWMCPLGALQEMLNKIPLPKKFKIKVPFKITNTIRFLIFFVFFFVLFSTAVNIYIYFNPFEAMHYTIDDLTIYSGTSLGAVILASIFIYRPFCYFICPMGLWTWIVEQISFFNVKLDKSKCTMCLKCVEQSPCPSVESILLESKIRPDCHACGACISVCPEKALVWKGRNEKKELKDCCIERNILKKAQAK